MNSSSFELLNLIDDIDYVEEFATLNTIQSIQNCYSKAIDILESYDGIDFSAYDIFQEGVVKDSMGQKYENPIFRIIAFLPRLLINAAKAIGKLFSKSNTDGIDEIKNVVIQDEQKSGIISFISKNAKDELVFNSDNKKFTVKKPEHFTILNFVKAAGFGKFCLNIKKIVDGDDKAYNDFKSEMDKLKDAVKNGKDVDMKAFTDTSIEFLKDQFMKNKVLLGTTAVQSLEKLAESLEESITQDVSAGDGDAAKRKTMLNNVLVDVRWLVQKIIALAVVGGVILKLYRWISGTAKEVKSAVDNVATAVNDGIEKKQKENEAKKEEKQKEKEEKMTEKQKEKETKKEEKEKKKEEKKKGKPKSDKNSEATDSTDKELSIEEIMSRLDAEERARTAEESRAAGRSLRTKLSGDDLFDSLANGDI